MLTMVSLTSSCEAQLLSFHLLHVACIGHCNIPGHRSRRA